MTGNTITNDVTMSGPNGALLVSAIDRKKIDVVE